VKKHAALLALLFAVLPSLWAQPASGGQSQPSAIETKTAGMQKLPGFFTLYWDAKEGKIWLEINKFDQEFLYATSLPAGLGSQEVTLDRNQPGRTRVVKFQRIGPKVLLVQPNYAFRATSADPDLKEAVEDSFARGVLWGFDVAAEKDVAVLVDASRFFERDACGAISTLNRRNQGQYSVDLSRSAFYMERTKSFPQNTEVEVVLTLASNNPGNLLRRVAADPEAIMLREHHSFVQLPDGEFKPRVFDPRAGFLGISYMDFASPVDEPIVKRFIERHRLRKKDPRTAVSDPVKPIVYYVDRGVPEPYRSALIEGAGWWNAAFEALGYRNAFQVKVLPEDADPMDIRYNMISWIHRASRGYNFGGAVTDPRTGEILKAQIVLDSAHTRLAYAVAASLVADYGEGKDNSKVMTDMSVACVRQLCCHEVGHTLGLDHNYAGSANDRASVMDYPGPLVKIRADGTLDLSDAYPKGIGEWDKVAMTYGYKDFPEGADEAKELRAILDGAFAKGMYFLANEDVALANRVTESAQPLVARWDNGADPVAELERMMKVRAVALANFSEKRIRMWEPMATLEEVLVPAYLIHRYEIDAAAGSLGGQYYFHKVRGDVQKNPEIVPGAAQRRALDVLLQTIKPEFLAIDKRILDMIPGRPPLYGTSVELFPRYTGQTFDPLAAAETAANLSVRMILQSERASRLVDFHARNKDYPGLGEVVDKLVGATWKSGANKDTMADKIGAAVKGKDSDGSGDPHGTRVPRDDKKGKDSIVEIATSPELLAMTKRERPPRSGRDDTQTRTGATPTSYLAEIQRVVDNVVMVYMMRLAVDEVSASPQARAIALLKLDELRKWLEARLTEEKDEDQKAHYLYGMTQIELFLIDPKGFKLPPLLTPPLGRAV